LWGLFLIVTTFNIGPESFFSFGDIFLTSLSKLELRLQWYLLVDISFAEKA
jgi:hypothetical protein